MILLIKFNNNLSLIKHTDYQLTEDLIVPSSTDYEYYDPLMSITPSIIDDVLGKRTVDADFDLHTLFINLNAADSGELLRFSKHFGLLYNPVYIEEQSQRALLDKLTVRQLHLRIGLHANLYTQDEQHLLSKANNRGVFLEEYSEEIERLKIIINLYTVIQNRNVAFLNDKSRFMLFFEHTLSHTELRPFQDLLEYKELQIELQEVFSLVEKANVNTSEFGKSDLVLLEQKINEIFNTILKLRLEDSILEMCTIYLNATFEFALKGVSPKITFYINNKPENTWVFSGVLAAIYFKMFQDFNEQKEYHLCENPNCQHLFVKKAKNNNYCSTKCQKRAKVYRNKERNRKKVIQLYQQGISIEEIYTLVKVEPRRISAWIKKFIDEQ